MNNKEYWSTRLEKLTNGLLKGQERDTTLFLKNYKNSLTEIQTMTNKLYAKYSKDGVLSVSEMYKFDRYKNMEKQITSIISDLGKEEKTYMTKELKKVYSESYLKTGELITGFKPNLAVSFTTIPSGFVEKAITYPWSGADFSSRIYKNKDILITNLKQTITKGMVEGKSITNMTKDLKKVMDISATNARRLIRTESLHVIASSHHDTYKKAGVAKVEYLTANDNRVCAECDALNNKIFKLEDAPMLPIHPNGRCVVIPYFDK